MKCSSIVVFVLETYIIHQFSFTKNVIENLICCFSARASNMWLSWRVPPSVWGLESYQVGETKFRLRWWQTADSGRDGRPGGLFVWQLWVHREHEIWVYPQQATRDGRLQKTVTWTWRGWVIFFIESVWLEDRNECGNYIKVEWEEFLIIALYLLHPTGHND